MRTRPWRELYKISANWRRGAVTSSNLALGDRLGVGLLARKVREEVLVPVPLDLEVDPESKHEQHPTPPIDTPVDQQSSDKGADTLLQFHRHHYFTASRTASRTAPTISVFRDTVEGSSLLLGTLASTSVREQRGDSLAITELRLDEHPQHAWDKDEPRADDRTVLRLAVFYSSGQFTVFRVLLPLIASINVALRFEACEIWTSPPPSPLTSLRPDPIVLARLHSPILCTCSRDFVIRFYKVSAGKTFQLDEVGGSWKSLERWSPVVLSIAPPPPETEGEGATTFLVTLSFSTMVFPSDWTVGVQQFLVKLDRRQRVSITARHALAPIAGPTSSWLTRSLRRSAALPPVEGLVTAIEQSDSWIVTSRTNNLIEVFQIVPPSTPFDKLRIVHQRSLFGHTAGVDTIALSGRGNGVEDRRTSRCISTSRDGHVKIWSLASSPSSSTTLSMAQDVVVDIVEEEPAVELGPSSSRTPVGTSSSFSTIAVERRQRIKQLWIVDEDKIVSLEERVGGEGVRILRFD